MLPVFQKSEILELSNTVAVKLWCNKAHKSDTLRTLVLDRAVGKCEWCGKQLKSNIQIHHKTYAWACHNDLKCFDCPKLSLCVDNLAAVHPLCNMAISCPTHPLAIKLGLSHGF